jgi:lysophospholipase L1-like esterase
MNKLTLLLLILPLISLGQNNIDYDKLYPKNDIIIKNHNYWTSKYYPERILEFKKNPVTKGGIVFLGNSITEGGEDWGERIKMQGVSNRGISGDITDGVLERLEEIIFYKPKIVFILIGHNDLWSLRIKSGVPSIEYIKNNILKIVESINIGSPKSSVYVQSILPTRHFTVDGYFENSINEINSFLKQKQNKFNFEFIDLHSFFVDYEGFLKKNLTTDGGHLNEDGYALWSRVIKDILNNINK